MHQIQRILKVGTHPSDSDKETKRIKILNLAIYVSLIHSVFFLAFDYLTATLDLEKSVALSIETLLYSSMLLMQHLRQAKAARLLFTFTVFTTLFYHSNYAFQGYYGEYQYIVVPMFSLFFFDKKYIHYGLLILALAAFYIPNLYLNVYPEEYFGYLNVLFLFLGAFLIVNYFKNVNDKNERLLKKEKDKVLADKRLLEKQQKELEELNAFKSRFFINLSHEIRTPITLIKGYSSKLIQQQENEENLESLSIIQDQAGHVEDIMSDLLDLGKLESDKLILNRETVNVLTCTTKLFTDFESLFREKQIEFEHKAEIPNLSIDIDAGLFNRALHNILNNAWKFTPRHGKVTLGVSFTDRLRITITDNGIGIPASDHDKVFERFYQSKNHITESQGTGIGLSFSKNIIEAHGFELSLRSVPDSETVFSITIPEKYISLAEHGSEPATRIKQAETSQVAEAELKPSLESKRILIVEDNKDMRKYLRLLLKDYSIVEANNGEEGLQQIDQGLFHAVITDYMMPVMNGVEFVADLKKQGLKVPIIVITARDDDKGKLNMLRLGIDAYLTKPFLEDELLACLEHSMALYEAVEAHEGGASKDEIPILELGAERFNTEIKAHIEQSIQDRNFGVDQLAELLHMSRSSLFRKTQFLFGQTPNELIGEARLQKARLILEANPDIRKKELAEAVGVHNSTYFYNKLVKRFAIRT